MRVVDGFGGGSSIPVPRSPKTRGQFASAQVCIGGTLELIESLFKIRDTCHLSVNMTVRKVS